MLIGPTDQELWREFESHVSESRESSYVDHTFSSRKTCLGITPRGEKSLDK